MQQMKQFFKKIWLQKNIRFQPFDKKLKLIKRLNWLNSLKNLFNIELKEAHSVFSKQVCLDLPTSREQWNLFRKK